MKTLDVWISNYLHTTFTCSVLSFTSHISSTFFFVLATIHLRCPWTSTFFQPTGFSLRFKNSSHVITFLWLCSLQNNDHLITILVFPTATKSGLAISCFSLLCWSPEEGKMSSVVQFTCEVLSVKGWFSYNRHYRFDRRCQFKKWCCDWDDYMRTLHERSLMPAAIGATTIAWNARVLSGRLLTDRADKSDSGDYMRTSL